MAANPNIAGLLQQLNNTGLQNKDSQLYQLLRELILDLAAVNNATASIAITTITGPQGPPGPPGFLDSDGGGSSDGDGNTIPGPAGTPGADGANGMVPYYIAIGETFTVPLYKQALFEMIIDNEGTLDVQGFLIAVD